MICTYVDVSQDDSVLVGQQVVVSIVSEVVSINCYFEPKCLCQYDDCDSKV